MGISDNPLVFLTRKAWEFSKGNRHNVVLYIVLSSMASAITFIDPFVIAIILNIIQEQGITPENMWTVIAYFALFILLTVLFWIFHLPAVVLGRRNSFYVGTRYKKYLVDGVLSLPAEWHNRHHSGEIISRIEIASGSLQSYSSRTYSIIEAVVFFIASYVILAYFNIHSSYIILAMVLIIVFVVVKIDKVLIMQYKELNKMWNSIGEKTYDILGNITTVIILRVERLVSAELYKKMISPFKLYDKNNKLNEVKWFIVSVIAAIMVFLVLATYIYVNVAAGTVVLAGTLFLLYSYVQRINSQFFRFSYTYGDIIRERAALSNVDEIVHEFGKKPKCRIETLGDAWQQITIKDLRFSYHSAEGAKLSLKDVSIVLKRSERIAFIGPSGSGKSTTLKIIRDLYTPSHIHVDVDGIYLKEGFKCISHDITLIPQDPELFSTTIKENITLGINHKMDTIRKHVSMARFTDVVARLPKKYYSKINEKGVNLSGGEKQRLALARGLLACEDKSIVLLDEPTSSVDLRNELAIYQNIFKRFKDKTIISSVHRLHLLPMFDKIYYFRNGKIIASGSFEELKKDSAEFRKLWNKYAKSSQFLR